MLLAIDTATRMASIALYQEGEVRSEHSWHSQNNHTVELMPNIVSMLKGQKVAPHELCGVAVALGPGSFTGLRIGMSVAKGLALALDIPLVSIPTLDILAYSQAWQKLPTWAIIKAGRGRICAAFYRTQEGQWQRYGDYLLTTIADLCTEVGSTELAEVSAEPLAEVKERALFCGEIDAQAADLLRERLAERAIIASPASSLRRAGYLAELGWQRLQRGETDDPATLAPIYLRHPPIR